MFCRFGKTIKMQGNREIQLSEPTMTEDDSSSSRLLDIFRLVLRRDDLAMDDDVFDFGCTSMLALKVTVMCVEADINVSIFDIYRNRTARNICPSDSSQQERPKSEIRSTPGEVPSEFEPTPTAQYLLYHAGFHTHYNIGAAWDYVSSDLDINVLRAAIRKVLEQNKVLRTRIFLKDERYVVSWSDECPAEVLEVIDLSEIAADEQKQHVEGAAARIQREFKFEPNKPLLRFVVFRLSAEHGIFFVLSHHMVLDGVSFSLLTRELTRFYRGTELGSEPRSLLSPNDPTLWSRRLFDYANGKACDEVETWRALPWEKLRAVRLIEFILNLSHRVVIDPVILRRREAVEFAGAMEIASIRN